MKQFTFGDIELSEINNHYKKKRSGWFKLIDVFLVVYILCILSYLAFSIVFIKAQVIGISMQPLFNARLEYSQNPKDYDASPYQDVAYVNRYKKGTNGDIVLLEILDNQDDPESTNIVIKRIIATGGQRVTLRREEDGNYYYYVSNDVTKMCNKFEENYVSQESRRQMRESYFETFKKCAPTVTLATEQGKGAYLIVPQGEVFVLGDNRPLSEDSHVFGTVKTEKILGKVSFYYAYNENLFSYLWSRFWGLFKA